MDAEGAKSSCIFENRKLYLECHLVAALGGVWCHWLASASCQFTFAVSV
jgi:hypothetical protein